MFIARPVTTWQLRTRSVELGARTLVMAVVNLTPDSFSDGGSYMTTDAAVTRCLQCLEEGADILDLGAESTRPGSHAGGLDAAVSAAEEQDRLLPVMEAVMKMVPRAVLSVDTYKAFTARIALQAGAEAVNDVSGFAWDTEMARVCSEARCGVVLMHTRGRPDEWRGQPKIAADELVRMVRDGLKASIESAADAGIARDAIIVDPGYGFGKRFGENFSLLAHQDELLSLGRPLMAGLSRKSFLGHALAELYEGRPAPMDERENASAASMVGAILNGASVVRVHDVRRAVEAARIADAILAAQG
jgi:dihydropteroate synthase